MEVGYTDLGWWIWGSVMGSSLDTMGRGTVGEQVLVVRVLTEVKTTGLSAWDSVTTTPVMVGPGRIEPINKAD